MWLVMAIGGEIARLSQIQIRLTLLFNSLHGLETLED